MGRSRSCWASNAGLLLLDGITSDAGPKRSPWRDAAFLLGSSPSNRCNFCHGPRRSAHLHTPVALVGTCPPRGHLGFPIRVLFIGPRESKMGESFFDVHLLPRYSVRSGTAAPDGAVALFDIVPPL